MGRPRTHKEIACVDKNDLRWLMIDSLSLGLLRGAKLITIKQWLSGKKVLTKKLNSFYGDNTR